MMTNRPDAARDFLRSLRPLRQERKHSERRLEQLYAEAARITATYTPLTGGVGDQHRDALLIELADRAAELRELIKRQWSQEHLVEEFIDEIPDERHRTILRLRYVDCLRWPKVLEEMERAGLYYDERQMYRLHGSALQAARGLYPEFELKHSEMKEETE
jgi:hypothetical protein